jgi:chorismate synthase
MLAFLEGIPRGLELDLPAIDADLRLRQGGVGRGGRQRIESDTVRVLAGVRRGRTIGAPLCLVIANRDASLERQPGITRPRPGHADLAGCYRFLDQDIRSTLERASARETAARVAAGAVAKQLLRLAGSHVVGFVRAVGTARLASELPRQKWSSSDALARRNGTRMYTLSAEADRRMVAEVVRAAKVRDTVGGILEVRAFGVLPGLGSHGQWQDRLGANLAHAVMSIQAIKGVEIGDAFLSARLPGSRVHDPILPGRDGLMRPTNHAGGIEGGMSNGQQIVLRAAMKPISTLRKPLPSVDLATGLVAEADYQRSDVCAVSAAAIVAEAMVALVLADAYLLRVRGETIDEFVAGLRGLRERHAGILGGLRSREKTPSRT